MFDCFIKVDSIPGESADDKHKEWIEVLSYNHGVSQPSGGSISATGGIAGQRCDHQDFHIVKVLDKASPKLALACCKGDHIKEVIVELCKAGGEKNKYMQYKMSDCIVRSLRPGGSSKGGDELPLEEVSIAYAKIEWIYTEHDNKGKPKGDIKGEWDLAANKGA